MSNWSMVILAWSGLESIRPEDIGHFEGRPWAAHEGCTDDDPLGFAVETVMILEANHFDPLQLRNYVRGLNLSWRYPEQVQIIWKNENHEGYRVERVFPWPSTLHFRWDWPS